MFSSKYTNRFKKPGQSKFNAKKKDQVDILSECIYFQIIYNEDQRSRDYSNIQNKFRPGHADFTYHMKYKNFDYRGGGRSSARETAMRVAAGALADLYLKKVANKLKITSAVIQIGNEKITSSKWNEGFINKNPFFSPSKSIIKIWEELILYHRKKGSSLGAIVEVRVKNCPAGLGEPIYQKIDSELSKAKSINAVKELNLTGFNLIDLRTNVLIK